MRYCDSCKLDVKIGFSRESNWTTHTESAAHHQNKASKGTPGKSKLTSFFQKKLPGSSPWSSPSAASPSLLCNPMHSFSSLSLAGPSSAPHIIDTPNDELIVVDSDGLPPPPTTIPPVLAWFPPPLFFLNLNMYQSPYLYLHLKAWK